MRAICRLLRTRWVMREICWSKREKSLMRGMRIIRKKGIKRDIKGNISIMNKTIKMKENNTSNTLSTDNRNTRTTKTNFRTNGTPTMKSLNQRTQIPNKPLTRLTSQKEDPKFSMNPLKVPHPVRRNNRKSLWNRSQILPMKTLSILKGRISKRTSAKNCKSSRKF